MVLECSSVTGEMWEEKVADLSETEFEHPGKSRKSSE